MGHLSELSPPLMAFAQPTVMVWYKWTELTPLAGEIYHEIGP